jgi:hypothetical protein
MANKGRRMVFEEDIKNIGQGGGATYTAGANISISDQNVISATDTTYTASNGVKLVDNDIQADTTVMATNAYAQTAAAQAAQSAVQNGSITVDKNTTFTKLPGDYDSISEWFADVPVLQTNGFTDAATFGHPVIEGDQNASGFTYIDLAGTYIIRDTANNVNQLICTYTSNIGPTDTESSRASNLRHYLAFRSGNNDWSCPAVRYAGTLNIMQPGDPDPTVYATAIKLSRSIYFGSTTFNSTGISGQSIDIRIGKLKANYNAAVATPTTEGTYKLNIHVDSNGEVDTVSWVAETI